MRSPYWLYVVGVVIAAVYWRLFSNVFNLPRDDDYDAILNFMNGFVSAHGAWAKFCFFLASQHNEYKLFFMHAIVIAQHALTGTINFAVLQVLGDLGLLGIFAVLALHLPGEESLWRKGLLLLPLAFLSFSLRPVETLNWATGGLQTIPVVVFSLFVTHFVVRSSAKSGIAACVCLALAIAASGNGFFVLCSGTLALLERRRFRLLVPWLLTGLICGACYAYRYTPVVKQPAAATAPHGVGISLLFPLTFLGNMVSAPALATSYGAVLLVSLVLLIWSGLRQKEPFVFHAGIFVLLTAMGVTVTRHAGGLVAAVPSRYTLYGLLFTSLIYLGALCCLKQRKVSVALPTFGLTPRLFVIALFTTVSFLLWAHHIVLGTKLLAMEKNGIQRAFSDWEHGSKSNPAYIAPLVHSKDLEELGQRASSITERSEQLHVMTPYQHRSGTMEHSDR